jgi:hypothetical protein
VVNAPPPPLYPRQTDAVPIVQEAGWAPGAVRTTAEDATPTGIRSPDRPAPSKSLYRLRQRWTNSRSRRFLICIKIYLPPQYDQLALRLTALLDQPTSAKKPSPRSRKLNEDIPKPSDRCTLQYCLYLCLSNYEPSFSKS